MVHITKGIVINFIVLALCFGVIGIDTVSAKFFARSHYKSGVISVKDKSVKIEDQVDLTQKDGPYELFVKLRYLDLKDNQIFDGYSTGVVKLQPSKFAFFLTSQQGRVFIGESESITYHKKSTFKGGTSFDLGSFSVNKDGSYDIFLSSYIRPEFTNIEIYDLEYEIKSGVKKLPVDERYFFIVAFMSGITLFIQMVLLVKRSKLHKR